MLVTALKCISPGVAPDACVDELDRGWDWSRGTQVTLHGNVFLRTGQRHPRMAGSAYLHMVDNVVAFLPVRRPDGTFGASYGTFVGGGSRAVVTNNLYVPLIEKRASFAVSSAETAPRANQVSSEGRGAMRAEGNVVIGTAVVDQRRMELVPPPPYDLRPARDFAGDPQRAARCALLLTGPDAPLRPTAAACK